MSSLKSRVLVSVVCIPLLFWIVLWAPVRILTLALTILSMIAARELLMCVGALQKEKPENVLLLLTEIAAICTVTLSASCWPIVWAVYVVLAFLYAIIRAGEVKFVQVLAGIFAAIIVPYSFSGLYRIYEMGLHRAYLLLPFILSFGCDTFAYFVGCSIGKHKLAPKVSPKKSVEGSVGGLAGNVLCGLIFAFVMDRWFGGSVGYGSMAILALACGIVAQVGDLSFSLVKREFGIKDYGKLFRAHGGVLDRFDSVLFVLPFIEIILNLVR